MDGRWGDAPFAAITPCLAVGIYLRHLTDACDVLYLWVAALALSGAAALAFRRRRDPAALCCGLGVICLAGSLLAHSDSLSMRRNPVLAGLGRGEITPGVPGRFDACLEDEPLDYPEEAVVTASLRAIEKRSRWVPAGGLVLLRVGSAGTDETEGFEGGLRAGDRVRGWAHWGLPRNFQNPGAHDRVSFLRRRGIGVIGRVKSARLLEVVPGDCAHAGDRVVQTLRLSATRVFSRLADAGRREEAAVLSSVVVGDYSLLGRTLKEAFQNSGTYHVLVVSGLHVAWIAVVLVALLRLLLVPAAAARLAVAAAIIVYASIVGWQASISRALWMFLLHLVGRALFRNASPVNITLASGFCLLAANTEWLFDAGFQLSFLSVLAICLTAVPVTENVLKPLLQPLIHCGETESIGTERGRFHTVGRSLRFRLELALEALTDRCPPAVGRAVLRACRGCGRLALAAGATVIVSLSVQLWLEPVLALNFNRLSWIAPLANLVLVPLSSFVLAAGLVAALTGPIPLIASLSSTVAAAAAAWLIEAARGISALPHAWQRCPTPSALFVSVLTVLVFAAWFVGSRWRFLLFGVTAFILLLLGTGATARWMPPGLGRANPAWVGVGKGHPVLSVTFLDVGQGDSAAVSFPDGRLWMVDAGGIREAPARAESAPGFDVGESVVSPYLWWLWIRDIDRLVLTHSHRDHAGGMPALIRNFRVAGFDFARAGMDPDLRAVVSRALERDVPVRMVSSGYEWSMGAVRVQVLHPPDDGRSRAPNDCSVVLRLEYGDFRGLLTGDIERAAEAEILARTTDLSASLLKVAHHGGRSSSLDGFLERVRPRWGVVSAGRNNPFGHPAREAIARLLRHGTLPVLTMDHGAVHFETDGRQFSLESHRLGLLARGTLPPARPQR